ncbi:hypothetical protein SH668x_000384 [Planctomicrobium sp. SH668]|uniref:hypothetical protein n=1 Tax=Planctomicrobium sp. SH668 TaxID=3448126 RepID=UPI003F5B6A49
MKASLLTLVSCYLVLAMSMNAVAQESEEPTSGEPIPVQKTIQESTETIVESSEKAIESSRDQLQTIQSEVDKNETAKEVSAGILKPIYLLAEKLSFSAFHWLAFALMFAGVVGFALQLVFTKLWLLTRLSLSLSELLSDAMGLVISSVGLVLTTQAAAENSQFTQSPAAVISASLLGLFVGWIHYRWGQAQEFDAATGRSKARTGKAR